MLHISIVAVLVGGPPKQRLGRGLGYRLFMWEGISGRGVKKRERVEAKQQEKPM